MNVSDLEKSNNWRYVNVVLLAICENSPLKVNLELCNWQPNFGSFYRYRKKGMFYSALEIFCKTHWRINLVFNDLLTIDLCTLT